MKVRSWMAVVVLAGGTTGALVVSSHAQKSTPNANQEKAGSPQAQNPEKAQGGKDQKKSDSSTSYSLELNLMIAGLGRDGCDVEVKPGNRSSRFQPQVQHVGSHGKSTLVFRDIELRGADRTCTFAITLREAGQEARTIYRGFRIVSRSDSARSPSGLQSFTCFMSSPSKLARLERSDRFRQ
jgi:hypothetical protein